MPPRVLIITASIGEGHDLPARTLADQLRDERPGVEIELADCLPAMGRIVAAVAEGAPRLMFFRFEWLWDLSFLLAAGLPPTRRAAQCLLERFAGAGLLELVRSARPDVVVSTYPAANEVLARLRRKRRLGIPVISAITDVAGMHYWAAPGADLYLVTQPEVIPEVLEIAGEQADVRTVHGLTAPDFLEHADAASARASLALPRDGKVVIVSGGGWGVGDLRSPVEAALAVAEVAAVVCLCGRNDELRERLGRRFGTEPRFRAEGFTDRMPDWLAAADVLVHSTGGLTVLEAQMRGCAVVSYGWGRGHIRLHNKAFRRFDLAHVAGTRAELERALLAALRSSRDPDTSFASLPSAASHVLAAVP
ncbi:MAG: glycosyltransferase [Gaiellaceae bacterium]